MERCLFFQAEADLKISNRNGELALERNLAKNRAHHSRFGAGIELVCERVTRQLRNRVQQVRAAEAREYERALVLRQRAEKILLNVGKAD